MRSEGEIFFIGDEEEGADEEAIGIEDSATGVTWEDGGTDLKEGTMRVDPNGGSDGRDPSFMKGPSELIGMRDESDIMTDGGRGGREFNDGMRGGVISFEESEVEEGVRGVIEDMVKMGVERGDGDIRFEAMVRSEDNGGSDPDSCTRGDRGVIDGDDLRGEGEEGRGRGW